VPTDPAAAEEHDGTRLTASGGGERGALPMNDFPIHHDSTDDESTEGHKIRWIDDADDSVNRNIDESTSGHLRRMDVEDADEESTEGHRRAM
jgi:hypothetical protein